MKLDFDLGKQSLLQITNVMAFIKLAQIKTYYWSEKLFSGQCSEDVQ